MLYPYSFLLILVLVLSLIFICADDIITCKFDLGTFWRKSCFFCLHTLCNLSIVILVISNYDLEDKIFVLIVPVAGHYLKLL